MKTKIQERAAARIELLNDARSALSNPGAWLDKSEAEDLSFACPALTLCDNAATTMIFASRAKAQGRMKSFEILRTQAHREFPSAEAIRMAIDKYAEIARGGER